MRHLIGFMDVEMPSSLEPSAAQTLRARVLGAGWIDSTAGATLSVEYSDTTVGFVRNDSCAWLDAERE